MTESGSREARGGCGVKVPKYLEFLTHWSKPAEVTIVDWRVGAFYCTLFGTALGMSLWLMIDPKYGFARMEEAEIDSTKAISFWFEGAAAMAAVKNASYYGRSIYDYYYPGYSGGSCESPEKCH